MPAIGRNGRLALVPAASLALFLALPAARSVAQPSEGSAFPAGGLYRGKTSQRWNVALRVAPGGGRVTLFASSVTLACRASGDYTETRRFLPGGAAAIGRDGRFSHRFSRQDGTVYKFSGRFVTRRRAVGTLTMSSVKVIFGGSEVCVTPGTVKWSATRR